MSTEASTPRQKASPRLRKLILASVVIFSVSVLVALGEMLPLAGGAVSKQASLTIGESIQIILSCVWPVLTVAGWVGLWRGRPWGRWIYLASWLLGVAVTFVSHAGVVSGYSMALMILSGLIGGAILGLAFSSDSNRTSN